MMTGGILVAQDSTDAVKVWTLESLQEKALETSPILQGVEYELKMFQEKRKIAQKRILDHVSFVSSYQHGNIGTLNIQQDNFSPDTYNQLSDVTMNRFVVGVNLQLPLGQVVSRRNQIRMADYDLEVKSQQFNKAKNQILNEVNRLYFDLKQAEKLIKIYGQNVESSKLNLEMATLQFGKGELKLTDLNRVIESYTKAQVQFNEVQQMYLKSKYELQVLVGETINAIQ